MREMHATKIEVHVSCICMRVKSQDYEILLGLRSSKRSFYPGKWECGGGCVHSRETFEAASARQIFEEFSIKVRPVAIVGTYSIESNIEFVPGLTFLCECSEITEPIVDGEEIVEAKWCSYEQAVTFDLIPGVRRDLEKAMLLIPPIVR